jgi:hypothetical protein
LLACISGEKRREEESSGVTLEAVTMLLVAVAK